MREKSKVAQLHEQIEQGIPDTPTLPFWCLTTSFCGLGLSSGGMTLPFKVLPLLEVLDDRLRLLVCSLLAKSLAGPLTALLAKGARFASSRGWHYDLLQP